MSQNSGDLTKFFLFADSWNTNSYSTEFVSKSETQLSITDLKPLTKYNFRIYAINAIGKSDFSEISATTDEESEPPLTLTLRTNYNYLYLL